MSYASTVLGDGPSHYWRLNDNSGYLAFDLGSAPQALVCACTSPILGYSGVASDGGALYCSQNPLTYAESNVTLGAVALPSMEGWVWTGGVVAGNPAFLLGWDGGTNPGFTIYLDVTNHLNGNYNTKLITDAAVFPLNQWVHVALAYDAGTLRLFKNGVQVASGAIAGFGAYSQLFVVGRRVGVGASTTALFSEVATYPFALSAAQAAAHVAAADTRTSQPVWHLPGGNTGAVNSFTPLATVSDDILNSVRRTY